MTFRLLIPAASLLLFACSDADDAVVEEGAVEAAMADDQPDNLISCAIAGANDLARNCAVERSMEDGVLFLTLHHEDGGFRRLQVMDDGSGVSAADGADDPQITVFDGEIEVSLGGDRYVLPATITGDGAQ